MFGQVTFPLVYVTSGCLSDYGAVGLKFKSLYRRNILTNCTCEAGSSHIEMYDVTMII